MIGKKFLLNTSAIAIATAFLPGLVRADVTLDSGAGLAACLFDAGTCGTSGVGYSITGATGGTITDGGITTSNNTDPILGSIPNESVAVTPDSLWEANGPTNPTDQNDSSAIWIGAVKSGMGDPDFVASNLSGPAYQITSQTFTVGANGGLLSLDVWADDTTAVLLSTNGGLGVQIGSLPAPTNQQNGPECQGTRISCQPGADGVLIPDLLSQGTYSLTFQVWQTGGDFTTTGNPTGLLYTGGEVDITNGGTNVSAPEAGVVPTLLSMLIGLAAFAGIFKKKLA